MKNPVKIGSLSICLILVINSNPLHGKENTFTEEFTRSQTFVDKTLLLKEFFENETRVFITAPPGFGKTTNLKMMQKFCQVKFLVETPWVPLSAETLIESDNIFTAQKIGKYDHIMKHMGQHPVIYLDFKIDTQEDEKLTREQNILRMFKDVIVRAANDHKDTIVYSNHSNHSMIESKFALELDTLRRLIKDENTTTDLPISDHELVQSVRFLSKFLSGYYNRTGVVLLIDNYDYTIRKSYVDSGGCLNLFDKFIEEFLRESLKSADNEPDSEIKYAMIASVTSLKFNFEPDEKVQKFLFYDDHQYYPYFGLAEREIDDLLERHSYNESDKSIINQYCNGLETKLMCQKIYNTSCTLDYLNTRTAKTSIRSSPTNFIWKLLKDPEYLDLFSKLLKNCPTRHGSHDFISFADFSKLVESNFNEPFISGGNCTAISFLIQQALLAPIRGKATFHIPNHLARQQIISDMQYYYEKEANIDLKQLGSYLYDIFVSIKANTTLNPDLDRYLTKVFRQFKPINVTGHVHTHFANRTKKVKNLKPTSNDTNFEVSPEPSKNSTATNLINEGETSLKFAHQSIIHLAALINPNLKVIEGYPQPISYDRSRSNVERRCVTCIVHENIALIVKNTDTVSVKMSEERAHKFYSYSEPGVDLVRYLTIRFDDQKQVTTSVTLKKIVVQGNGTKRRRKKKANMTRLFSTIIVGNTTVIVGNTSVMIDNASNKSSGIF